MTVPIRVAINDITYYCTDWSICAFKITGIYCDLKPGDTCDAYVTIPFHGFDVGFTAKIRVLRHDRQVHELAAEFVNLDARGENILKTFVQGIVSGDMVNIDGIIKRLDQPVTPVSLANQLSDYVPPDLLAVRRRRGMRLYYTAGVVLAVLLLAILYSNFFQIRVDTAFVMGRNDVIIAPAEGDITYLAPLNQVIPAGAPLLTMYDQRLEDDIRAADFKVRDTSVEVKRLNSVMDTEKKRLTASNAILSDEMNSSMNNVKTLEKSLEAKKRSLALYEKLFKEGYTSRIILDRVQGEYFTIEYQLNLAKQEAERNKTEYSSARSGLEIRNRSVENGINDIASIREAAVERAQLAMQDYDAMMKRKERLTIDAPAEGRLVRAFASQYSASKYGEPLAVFERNGTRVVQAYLTQQEALHLTLGQRANVYFPNHWWSVPHKVTDIDFYSLTLNQTRGLFQWQNFQGDNFKTVVVTLEPIDEKGAQDMRHIASGTASTVVFSLL